MQPSVIYEAIRKPTDYSSPFNLRGFAAASHFAELIFSALKLVSK